MADPPSSESIVALTAVPAAESLFVTKASAFRGMMTALKAAGHYDAVYARVPPHVQKLMDSPPLGISWMPALAFQHVLVALRAVAGMAVVRSVGEDSVLQGPLKTMQPVVQSMLRLFGAEPMAFYRRLPQTLAGQLKGVEFGVKEVGPRAVAVIVTYSYLRNPPLECFVYWEGAMAVTWKICGVHGTASTALVPGVPEGNRAQIDISWTK